jgi:hypothetical protein
MVRDRGGLKLPVALDHGLSFPVGKPRELRDHPMPTGVLEGQVGALLAETTVFIRGIDPHTVARTLVAGSADDRQVAHVLRRLEHMKRDASFLEIKRDGPEGMSEMLARVAEAAESRSQDLPSDVSERLNQIIRESRR